MIQVTFSNMSRGQRVIMAHVSTSSCRCRHHQHQQLPHIFIIFIIFITYIYRYIYGSFSMFFFFFLEYVCSGCVCICLEIFFVLRVLMLCTEGLCAGDQCGECVRSARLCNGCPVAHTYTKRHVTTWHGMAWHGKAEYSIIRIFGLEKLLQIFPQLSRVLCVYV